jgi:hypothetical protein
LAQADTAPIVATNKAIKAPAAAVPVYTSQFSEGLDTSSLVQSSFTILAEEAIKAEK